MNIEGAVALVTGANRGIGKAFTSALVERGAKTVYAGARDPRTVGGPGVVPIELDVTNPAAIAAAARTCADVTLLVNNAGVVRGGPLVGAPGLDGAREEIEVNYFGTLAVTRAFAPVLAANGGGVIVNMLSVLSFLSFPAIGSYCASKAAAWSLTNGVRVELAEQGTLVVAVHAGYVDTDMAARVTGPKLAPAVVVAHALDAVEAGTEEVLVDPVSQQTKQALPRDLELLYPDVRSQWANHPLRAATAATGSAEPAA
ncbi:SDR family oxidoreductase [Protofrankia sp. BMG5.30]|uniref:SDR family oxidoreductase n=1 Tax=Protofrankia sp. BMG5.30 TaxID=1834514 RepID=UPI000976A1C9|nr:SDR family oxidoreductase [Protofrankia sp. BMG5.30]ONH31783.1 short-chain dehydrogenase [Protofrankia sp. BMG5.30]